MCGKGVCFVLVSFFGELTSARTDDTRGPIEKQKKYQSKTTDTRQIDKQTTESLSVCVCVITFIEDVKERELEYQFEKKKNLLMGHHMICARFDFIKNQSLIVN